MGQTDNTDMVINLVDDLFKNICDNFDKVRGHSLASSIHCPKAPSLSSSECDEDYAIRVQRESDKMVNDDLVILSNSPQLEYATPKSQVNQVSKVADLTSNTRQQHVENVGPALNSNLTDDSNIFNVQLNYDINQALDSESWDGNFQAILFYGSMKHLASNIKNIKNFLNRIRKYILSKSIKGNKANNIKDLEGVSKVAWGFISFLYKVY